MSNIPTQLENETGLHQRYYIEKIVKEGEELKYVPVDIKSEYFVMRLDTGGSDIEHIKACRVGINAYADAIQHHLPELAKDLKERYPLLDAIAEKRLFQVLDQMNVLDSTTGSSYIGICGNQNVLSVDRHGEKGVVKMGVPPNIPVDILKGKDIRLMLCIVDGKKYDELSK